MLDTVETKKRGANTNPHGDVGSPFEQCLNDLYQENLRGAWELEALRYSLCARLGLDEADALELAVWIALGPRSGWSRPGGANDNGKQAKTKQRLQNG